MNALGDIPPQRLRINGVELSVRVAGEGPAVLLIHGFPDDHRIWSKQVPALLAAGYRVIVPDTRGCGESQLLAQVRDYKLPLLVADLVALLDALGVSQARVVGHDWGAVIGWHLAMAHPERVVSYVALSVGHPEAYARAGLMQKIKGWYALMFQLRGVAEWFMRVGNWTIFRRFTNAPTLAPQWIAQLSRPGRLTAGLNYYRANIAMVLPGKRPAVRVPVLGVYSTGDRFLSEDQMVDSARYVSAAWQYRRLDGVGHWMSEEAPELLNAMLLEYFAG